MIRVREKRRKRSTPSVSVLSLVAFESCGEKKEGKNEARSHVEAPSGLDNPKKRSMSPAATCQDSSPPPPARDRQEQSPYKELSPG